LKGAESFYFFLCPQFISPVSSASFMPCTIPPVGIAHVYSTLLACYLLEDRIKGKEKGCLPLQAAVGMIRVACDYVGAGMLFIPTVPTPVNLIRLSSAR
jgi:hypothetical protein